MLLLLLLLALASGTMQSVAVDRERLLLHLKKAAAASGWAQKPATHVKKIPVKHPKTLLKGRVVAPRHATVASSVKHLKQAVAASDHLKQTASGHLKQTPSGHFKSGPRHSKHATVVKHPALSVGKEGKTGPEDLKQQKKKALARTESRYFGKYKYF